MKVSVIIPTRNRIPMLTDAVRSVLEQTVPPYEVIVVDDASDEDVGRALEAAFPGAPVQLLCLRQPEPRGACSARNRGAQAARGGILMFLDDDDTWEPEKIRKQLDVFDRHPDVGLVYTGRLLVPDTDRRKIIGTVTPKARGWLYPAILYDNLIGSTSSVAMKKQLFIEAGGFDERFPAKQDYDLWIRCAKLTRIEHDGGYHVRYTVSTQPGRQISAKKDVHVQAVRLLLSKYAEDIEKQGPVGKRKIMAANYFTIAKAAQRHNYWLGLKWYAKSLLSYPNPKSALGLIPLPVLQWCRRKLTSWRWKPEAGT